MVDALAAATGPAVWSGRDFFQSDEWVIHLTPDDVAELENALEYASTKDLSIQDITATDFPLPKLGKRLENVAKELEYGRGFCVLRGFPIDARDEDDLKVISWGTCSHFGAGIPQSRQGDWINHVMDVSDQTKIDNPDLKHIIKRGALRTNHAGGELDFHTDTTDIFALFCIRNAKSGGASRLVSSATLHNLILAEKPHYARALYEGYYYMSQTVDSEEEKPKVSANRVPVFTRKGDTIHGYYISQVVQRAIDQGGIMYDKVEDDARIEIQRVAERCGVAHEFMLEPGDLLLANNRKVMHARQDYEDYPELDRRRHLLRLWMATTDEMKTKTFQAPSDRFS